MDGLTRYYVSLHEHHTDQHTIAFYCWAEDEEHASEQALNAYPDGNIAWIEPVRDSA